MSNPGRAVFLSYASPAFAKATAGRQDVGAQPVLRQ
jgi:hypothetical protein